MVFACHGWHISADTDYRDLSRCLNWILSIVNNLNRLLIGHINIEVALIWLILQLWVKKLISAGGWPAPVQLFLDCMNRARVIKWFFNRWWTFSYFWIRLIRLRFVCLHFKPFRAINSWNTAITTEVWLFPFFSSGKHHRWMWICDINRWIKSLLGLWFVFWVEQARIELLDRGFSSCCYYEINSFRSHLGN